KATDVPERRRRFSEEKRGFGRRVQALLSQRRGFSPAGVRAFPRPPRHASRALRGRVSATGSLGDTPLRAVRVSKNGVADRASKANAITRTDASASARGSERVGESEGQRPSDQ